MLVKEEVLMQRTSGFCLDLLMHERLQGNQLEVRVLRWLVVRLTVALVHSLALC